jgi:DNA-binding NtrC family response regulator
MADLFFLVLTDDPSKATEHLQSIRLRSAKAPIIAVNDGGKMEQIVSLLRSGISDYVVPPLEAIDVFPRVWRLLADFPQRPILLEALRERTGLRQLIGESKAFITEINKIPAVARCDASVLILGETGTGKEVCARAIHYLSLRTNKPFIPVNCAAIPLELVENELFGHERGAFSGASTNRSGLIHEASGGTLFLDEIDCLPLLAQVKLLRFLQEKEYRQLGSTKMQGADVRVIAATNVNIEKAVKEGRFRQDFYYRLNVIPLALPPLRERKDDILLLARHFLAKHVKRFGKQTSDFSPDAIQRLICYDWPGNVRELEHIVERALVLSDREVITGTDILLSNYTTESSQETFSQAKSRLINQFESSYIQGLLLAYRGNITHSANAAKKSRRDFWRLIRKHNLDAESFRVKHKEVKSQHSLPNL